MLARIPLGQPQPLEHGILEAWLAQRQEIDQCEQRAHAEQQARLPALLMPEAEQVCEQRRLAGLALGSRQGRFCGAIC